MARYRIVDDGDGWFVAEKWSWLWMAWEYIGDTCSTSADVCLDRLKNILMKKNSKRLVVALYEDKDLLP